jgi:hypothetical protein
MSEHVSTVVKRREQSGHWRRLRIDVPSSVVRLSTTRLSGCLHNRAQGRLEPAHAVDAGDRPGGRPVQHLLGRTPADGTRAQGIPAPRPHRPRAYEVRGSGQGASVQPTDTAGKPAAPTPDAQAKRREERHQLLAAHHS